MQWATRWGLTFGLVCVVIMIHVGLYLSWRRPVQARVSLEDKKTAAELEAHNSYCLESSHVIEEMPQPESPIQLQMRFDDDQFPRRWKVRRVILHKSPGAEFACLQEGRVTIEEVSKSSTKISDSFNTISSVSFVSGLKMPELVDLSTKSQYFSDAVGTRTYESRQEPTKSGASQFVGFDPPLNFFPDAPKSIGQNWSILKPVAADTAPAEGDVTVEGSFKKLVKFDGREAILMTSQVSYPAPNVSGVALAKGVNGIESRRCYIDAKTGRVLWSERKISTSAKCTDCGAGAALLADHPMVLREEILPD